MAKLRAKTINIFIDTSFLSDSVVFHFLKSIKNS